MPSSTAMQRRDATTIEQIAVDVSATLHEILSADDTRDAGRVRALIVQLLAELHELDEATAAALDRAVGVARRLDMSWDTIAVPLGVTRQTAWKRYKGVRPDGEPPQQARKPRQPRKATPK